jgi:hypothetical protein
VAKSCQKPKQTGPMSSGSLTKATSGALPLWGWGDLESTDMCPDRDAEIWTITDLDGLRQGVPLGRGLDARPVRRKCYHQRAKSWSIFQDFFTAGLHLSCHRFLIEVLQRFQVQLYQLHLTVSSLWPSIFGDRDLRREAHDRGVC